MFEEIAAGIIGQGVLYALQVIIGLIIADTLLGIIKAYSSKSFDVALLPDYLRTSILPYVGALVILGACTLYVQPELFGGIFAASAVAVIVKFVTDIVNKIKAMTGVKFETECSICGESMPYNMESFMGEPICDRCRTEEAGAEEGGENSE